MNANLAESLVPVNADIGTVDVVIVTEDDPHVNEIGVKGSGEIGIVGAAAAIANAVFHATGKRNPPGAGFKLGSQSRNLQPEHRQERADRCRLGNENELARNHGKLFLEARLDVEHVLIGRHVHEC
jgi:hypothetical protein